MATSDLPDAVYDEYAMRPAAVQATSPDALPQGGVLKPSSTLTSANGRYQLVVKADGNVVVELVQGYTHAIELAAQSDQVASQSDELESTEAGT